MIINILLIKHYNKIFFNLSTNHYTTVGNWLKWSRMVDKQIDHESKHSKEKEEEIMPKYFNWIKTNIKHAHSFIYSRIELQSSSESNTEKLPF